MHFRFDDLEPQYAALLDGARVNAQDIPNIDRVAKRLISHKDIYREVEKLTTVKWSVVAVIHEREASGNFNCHLHNGDPLSGRTYHVPKGRPIKGNPPFTWIESACDALAIDHLTDVRDWCMEHACFMWEAYNGWGYRSHHINTPYVWADTNEYTRGKYVADGQYSPYYVDRQIGCEAILLRMAALDPDAAMPRFADRKPHVLVPSPQTVTPPATPSPVAPPKPVAPPPSLSAHSQAPHPEAHTVSPGSWGVMWKRIVDFFEGPARL